MSALSKIKYFPAKEASLDILIRRNKKFKDNFKKNLLFRLMASGYFNSKQKRDVFLEYFQIWSNYFQKTMLLKTALCDNPSFAPTFNQHFTEEFGHDQMLNRERPKVNTRKDAVLEAVCNWFFSKMLSFSPYEQIVVMNLCVEACAVVFYEFAKPAIDPNNQLEHFQAHGEIDLSHEEMGLSLLEGLPAFQYERLFGIQEDTWAMCEALMQRLGELVKENAPSLLSKRF
jgi:hypothetical protein